MIAIDHKKKKNNKNPTAPSEPYFFSEHPLNVRPLPTESSFLFFFFNFRRSDERVFERELRGDHRGNEARRVAGDRQTFQELPEQRLLADTAESVAEGLGLIARRTRRNLIVTARPRGRIIFFTFVVCFIHTHTFFSYHSKTLSE